MVLRLGSRGSNESVVEMTRLNFPSFRRQREHVILIDKWNTGRQHEIENDNNTDPDGVTLGGRPFAPSETNDEYRDLSLRATDPWGSLIVKSLAQTAYVDGINIKDMDGNLKAWEVWQKNGWDAKQIPLHRSAIAHGVSFGQSLPARDPFTNDKSVKRTAYSAKKMAAFYDDDDDEWPRFAVWAQPRYSNEGLIRVHEGWEVRCIDERAVHYLDCKGDGLEEKDWTYKSYQEHGQSVPPIVRYCNNLDLDGRTVGEIEPVLPILRRLDQDTFDRLIVQRFGAWKVRWIAGMAKPTNAAEEAAAALTLRIQDLLVSGDPETKFGTLDGTDLDGFIGAKIDDLKVLAAISQTASHTMLGINEGEGGAEGLAAAEAAMQRKSADFKTFVGEAHERHFRLDAQILGEKKEAESFDSQVRWRDTESRSLVQTANALGIVAKVLGVPAEMLWERLPNWTDGDTARAKRLIESGSADKLFEAILVQTTGKSRDEIESAGAAPAAGQPNSKSNTHRSTGGTDNEPKK